MSQVSTKNKRKLLASTVISTLAITSLTFAHSAHAQTRPKVSQSYAVALSDLASGNQSTQQTTLDWRKSSLDFTFDLPTADKIDKIELLISAAPRSVVNPRAPLTVQLNNEAPVMLKVEGQAFDARITFDPNKTRVTRNVIRLTYNTETQSECITPEDGGWDIDLDSSKLAINSLAKRRALQFDEIDQYLNTPGLAPRIVGLTATGPNRTQLLALAAQGVGLNMDILPDFVTNQQKSDFEIIMAPRSELGRYVSDRRVLTSRGPSIIIPQGRPLKLIFTGDTDEEILTSVKSFAQRKLPIVRRSATSLGEMRLQRPLKSDRVQLSGTKALSDIPFASSFSNWTGDDWATGEKSLRFDVTDPAAMNGEILLRLASSKNISDTSKLNVRLNGDSLGTTLLDKRRKSVGFKFETGQLRGGNNVLTLVPSLNPNETPTCKPSEGPNFHLGGGSKIILNTPTPSKVTELSRLAATAIPFSDDKGAQSYITMTGNSNDFNASLKILARLAKANGEGLIAANYSRELDAAQTQNKHVLFLGPSNSLPRDFIETAPRSLTDALRGQAFEGDNLISSNFEQFASLDADRSFKIAAQQLSKSRRVNQGGIAALYPSPSSNAHIIGVVTNTPRQDYASSAAIITQTPYWSEIKGGVARWNQNTILSVQEPQAVPGYTRSEPTNSRPRFNFKAPNFDGVINQALDISETLWTGIKKFSADISQKVQSIYKNETDLSGSEPIDKAESNPTKPDVSPNTSTPNTEQTDSKINWKTRTQNTLHAANDWARDTSTYLQNFLSRTDKTFVQKLFSPAFVFLILALLLFMLGLSTAGRRQRPKRGK